MVKNPSTMWETWVPSLGWEDPLEEGLATHSSTQYKMRDILFKKGRGGNIFFKTVSVIKEKYCGNIPN